jgi:hypothetical protein
MNVRNALGLPESCREQCSTPSCVEMLRALTGVVQVNQVGYELHSYPPRGNFFERECAEVILKLSICMSSVPPVETPAESS